MPSGAVGHGEGTLHGMAERESGAAADGLRRASRVTPRQAAQILAGRDPVIARLLAEAGPPSFPAPAVSHFAMLVRSVTYQQLAGAAARAIHGRLVAALDGEVTPGRVLATWQIPTPAPRQLDALGEPFRPYRSAAAWYCWRAAELYAGMAASAVTR